MPVKIKPIDWNAYLDGLIWKQDIESVIQELENMTGRDLYESPSYSMCARYLIDRPSTFAMHGTYTNYKIDCVKVMQTCLIDGEAYVKIGDWQHLVIEPYVIKTAYDSFTEELLEIWTSYKAEDDLIYTSKYEVGPPIRQINYKPQRVYDEERLQVEDEISLPYFPYVPFCWHNRESFLSPVHEAVIRLEAAYRVVAVENIERRGLALYLEGVRNIDDIQHSPRKLGRSVHVLPEGATFHSPASDSPGIDLMKWEIDQIWTGLEKATGVVSTEKLASLSGISRIIAEKPLIMLCEDIRDIFEDGMQTIEAASKGIAGAPPLEISYKPLREVESPGSYLQWIRTALDQGVITEDEYVREYRRTLALDSGDENPNIYPGKLKPEAFKIQEQPTDDIKRNSSNF